MRSRWSEAFEDVTPSPTDEEREETRERLRALDGFAPGRDGRCSICNVKPHPQAVKCCGKELKRHG